MNRFALTMIFALVAAACDGSTYETTEYVGDYVVHVDGNIQEEGVEATAIVVRGDGSVEVGLLGDSCRLVLPSTSAGWVELGDVRCGDFQAVRASIEVYPGGYALAVDGVGEDYFAAMETVR